MTQNKGEKCHWCTRRFQRGGALRTHVNKYHPNQAILLTDTTRYNTQNRGVDGTTSSDLTYLFKGNPIYDPPASAENADADFEVLPLFSTELQPQNAHSTEASERAVDPEHARAGEDGPHAGENGPRADRNECRATETQYGRAIREAPYIEENEPDWNPLAPFSSPTHYKMARYFVESKTPLTRIDEYFYSIIPPQLLGTSFGSAHTMRNKLRLMEEKYAVPVWQRGIVTYTISGQQEFFHRNILDCIQYLLRQKSFSQHWAWASKKEYDFEGIRQYHEMYTGDWWARIEVCNLFLSFCARGRWGKRSPSARRQKPSARALPPPARGSSAPACSNIVRSPATHC